MDQLMRVRTHRALPKSLEKQGGCWNSKGLGARMPVKPQAQTQETPSDSRRGLQARLEECGNHQVYTLRERSQDSSWLPRVQAGVHLLLRVHHPNGDHPEEGEDVLVPVIFDELLCVCTFVCVCAHTCARACVCVCVCVCVFCRKLPGLLV